MAADPTLADLLEHDAEQSYFALPLPGYDDRLRAAAVRLRKLDAAIESAVREIRASHYQDPLVRTLCVVCGAADGSYPCSALVGADALADALGGTEP